MDNILKDDDCTFGLDPMTIIPRMKLRDANYVVMQAVKEGHQRFEVEEVNPETKLKIYLIHHQFHTQPNRLAIARNNLQLQLKL